MFQHEFNEDNLGYRMHDTEYVILACQLEILQRLYHRPALTQSQIQMNRAINEYYQILTGAPMLLRQANTLYLRGMPGHGKTTAAKQAAKRVADHLDLDLVVNPGEYYQASERDFLFVSLEMSGEVSSTVFKGLPTIDQSQDAQGQAIKHLRTIPPISIAALANATAAVLLLDDFANASANIQNIGLSIAEEGRFQGTNLGQCYVILTGNLGAMDKTHVTATSAALGSRVRTLGVQDTLAQYERRILALYPDQYADAGLLGFLNLHPDLFYIPPKDKSGSPFAVSRTWDKLIGYCREQLHLYQYQQQNKPQGQVHYDSQALYDIAVSVVGKSAALPLRAYFTTLMIGAKPIAEQYLSQQPLSAAMQAELAQHMASPSDQSETFIQSFVYSLASGAAAQIFNLFMHSTAHYLEDQATITQLNQILSGFAQGVYQTGLAQGRSTRIAQAYSELKQRLVTLAAQDSRLGYWDHQHQPHLADELIKIMVQNAAKIPESQHKLAGVSLLDSTCINVLNQQVNQTEPADLITAS